MSECSYWLSEVTRYLELRQTLCEDKRLRRCPHSSYGQVLLVFFARARAQANIANFILLKGIICTHLLETSESFRANSACRAKISLPTHVLKSCAIAITRKAQQDNTVFIWPSSILSKILCSTLTHDPMSECKIGRACKQ